MQTHELVSVLVINWNGKQWIRQCLESLRQQRYPNLEIIVVDNASTDGSAELVKTRYPEVKLVNSRENLGFSGGNNLGIRSCRGGYVLLLNVDAFINEDLLGPLVKFMEQHPDVGVAQPKILIMDYQNLLDGTGSFFTRTGVLYHNGYLKRADHPKYKSIFPVYTTKGAAMLIRKEVIKRTMGLFDPEYFLYFEETDFCHRVWLAGYKVMYVPLGIVYHQGGGISAATLNNAFTQFHSYKNRITTYLKNLSVGELGRLLPIHLVFVEVSALIFLFGGQVQVFLSINKALWWVVKHTPYILRKRREVQQHVRTVRDHDYLKLVTKKPRLSYYFALFTGLRTYEDDEKHSNLP